MTRSNDVFKDKKRLMPRCMSRLPVFYSQSQTLKQTTYGTVEIMSGHLSQTHRDIIEAIATLGKKGIYKDGVRTFYLFSPYDVLKFLGHRYPKNYRWLFQKLAEIRSVNLKVQYKTRTHEITMVGGLIDHFAWSRVKRIKKKPTSYGENYFAIVMSEPFSALFEKDFVLYTSPKVVKAIIDMPHDFLKHLVRFVLTHDHIHLPLHEIIQRMGISARPRTIRKYAQEVTQYAEYLHTHFGIRVQSINGKIFISYTKDPRKVAIDYVSGTDIIPKTNSAAQI